MLNLKIDIIAIIQLWLKKSVNWFSVCQCPLQNVDENITEYCFEFKSFFLGKRVLGTRFQKDRGIRAQTNEGT